MLRADEEEEMGAEGVVCVRGGGKRCAIANASPPADADADSAAVHSSHSLSLCVSTSWVIEPKAPHFRLLLLLFEEEEEEEEVEEEGYRASLDSFNFLLSLSKSVGTSRSGRQGAEEEEDFEAES